MRNESDWGSSQQFGCGGFAFAEHFSITPISAVRQEDKIKIGDWPIFVLMDHREIYFQGKRTVTVCVSTCPGLEVGEHLPGGELLFFPGSCCMFAVTLNKSPGCTVASSNY